ncbi:hypothetical protein F4821DRAFT_242156 [Hypoxylon rubiginosum]|uniref:Uncharacterized protein n=1 Tax=Hypoxylon rubiginosum TaxID=110542 RepID=A0ACC0CW85_9PEZI|nr:hypothetical protein F4821DRAFT_242156 [Hypoxylon rubiginosum]
MNREEAPASEELAKDPSNSETLERARLRRNQRNSRARKQAYIRDLESRWNECVRLGAQATVEMQSEARRVQEENKLLRKVLHSQGFDDTAIQNALESVKSSTGNQSSAPEPPMRPLVAGPGPSQQEWINDFTWPWPTSGDAVGVVNSGVGPALDPDLVQSLDMHNWLNELCDIKDAFGAEAHVSI